MNTTTIEGVKYNIVKEITVESAQAEGLNNLAEEIKKYGDRVFLQRPNGRKVYFSARNKYGYYTKPVAIF